MTNDCAALQLAIWKEIAGMHLSKSHDRWHIDRVLGYATELARIYEADQDVITAAVVLHDLGRADPERRHGMESIHASKDMAARILSAVHFPVERREAVLTAIAEHDQPDRRPSTIEGRILKEADYLAGFGAWGALRIAMWSGETGRDVATTLDRMDLGMNQRAMSLEFPESNRWSRGDLAFARMFLEELRRTKAPTFHSRPRDSFYIVLEGVSGTGKNTQGELLVKALQEQGRASTLALEPSSLYKDLKEVLTTHKQGEATGTGRKMLFMLDRTVTASDVIEPALSAGRTVVGVRSFLSTLVYNCTSPSEVATMVLLSQAFPQPDLVLLLDLPAEEALRRIENRGEEQGKYETLDQLKEHAVKYRHLAATYFLSTTRIVDAAGGIEDTALAIQKEVSTAMEKI